jgi:hypothetical protein
MHSRSSSTLIYSVESFLGGHKLACQDKYFDAVRIWDISARDATSKGRIVQEMHCPRDGTPENFRSGDTLFEDTSSWHQKCHCTILVQIILVDITVTNSGLGLEGGRRN